MQKPEHRVRLRGSALSDTGRVRDNNEDSVHYWSHNDTMVLAVVADGMGGAAAGEKASGIAIETVKHNLLNNDHPPEFYNDVPEDTLSEELKQTIREANTNIVDKAVAYPEFKGMGTTMTLAFLRGTHALIAHVGDSRAYLINGYDGHIEQITSDHSFVQALVAAGHITDDEAEEHPMRNVLYRALGQSREVEVDIYGEHLHPGDRLVLCSDGLTLHVKPKEIASISLSVEDPVEVGKMLVNLANERGGRDNVSVIVIRVDNPNAGESAEETAEIAQAADLNEEDIEADTVLLYQTPGFASSESSPQVPEEPTDTTARKDDVRQTQTSEIIRIKPESDGSGWYGEGEDTAPTDQ